MPASAARRGVAGPGAGERALIGGSRKRAWLAGTLVTLGLSLLAFLGWYAWQSTREPHVRGVVVGVEARDIGQAAAIVLRTQDGKETRFLVDPSVGLEWSPGHLRDHMMFAQPVTVFYRRAGEAVVAYRITD